MVIAAAVPEPLSEAARRWLLFVARRALRGAMTQRDVEASALPIGEATRPSEPRLALPARVFVGWHDGRELIGRVGCLEPWPCLEQAVVRYAVQAGLHDTRSSPVRPGRWGRIRGEISVLGEPSELAVVGLAAIEAALEPGRDGVILSLGARQAAFLPTTWRELPRPRDVLAALVRRAGLSPEHDGARLRARVFRAETFEAPVVPAPAPLPRECPATHDMHAMH